MQFPLSRIPAANVSQVPQRSPLRYPGGKTWLIPHVREWLTKTGAKNIIEPFGGGAIVSLTAVMENLVDRAILIERDPDVAAFWRSALHHGEALIDLVTEFVPELERIDDLERSATEDDVTRGFRTLVLNRTRRAGILAPGASFIQRGEGDKGISSRWYPATLVARLKAISDHSDRIEFHERDSMDIMAEWLCGEAPDSAVFVDPPYTAGGKYAGRRLYAYNELAHDRLFQILAGCEANVLMTYDWTSEIATMINQHGFHAAQVKMMSAHHKRLVELVITRSPLFDR